MNRRKILFVIPNLGRGGAQKVFFQHLTMFKDDFEVYGCVFNWDGALASEQLSNISSLNVPGGRNLFEKAFYFLKRVMRLKRLKQELKIDVTVSHLEGADYVNLFSRHDDKVVCWIHGTKAYDRNIGGFIGFIRKRILIPLTYNRADQIITVSKGINSELEEVFGIPGEKLVTIYNGFDLTHITKERSAPVNSELGQIAGPNTIVTHCRLARQKNLPGLIEIFSRLQNPDVKLLILGDGELRDLLLEQCDARKVDTWNVWSGKALNRNARIFFGGHVSNPYPILSRCALYVMTSDWEGFPLALCEAMACGIPVISTDCYTGPGEILADKILSQPMILEARFCDNGILMPVVKIGNENVIKLWSDTLEHLIKHPEKVLRYKHTPINRIGQFDLDSTLNEVRKILRGI